LSTGIWWYSSYPNHYAGDASGATAARGAALQGVRAEGIAQAIAWVKVDTVAPQLQQEFFEKSGKPLETKQ
jgi:creatinine amidohydrolase